MFLRVTGEGAVAFLGAGRGVAPRLGVVRWVGVAVWGVDAAEVVGLATVTSGLALVADWPPSTSTVAALTTTSGMATVNLDRPLGCTLTARSCSAAATGSDRLRIDAA